ncbi:helix-turn-helix domain-containing protein [Ignatzschineria rhizosphaerae]|uniref:Helix-turn-helix domain-containing protein n=1 Tax=Ignatzschineria rhizosphaerae TaxID=2923279 RepID=A0ABY3WY88_9GAMM|nr:helix-turn-helix domain-containing protein [Ignatzschineria rhizosphaerae]UNM95588.1 helix-turn-helix domain-containing protein [Ignatzschineria rhizosphaerae]UNM95589.1 helix-turn-helix domain-containing protein [Ignatzschineria rhizosphaerae]
MTTYIKRTQKDYTLAFKLAVVAEVEAGAMTYKQAQHHYGIQGRSTVLVWLRKYGVLNWKSETPNILRLDIMNKPIEKTPEQRIKELEKKLTDSQDKNQFFEELFSYMENDMGIELPKKLSQRLKEKGK